MLCESQAASNNERGKRMNSNNEEFRSWLRKQPKSVQRLAKKYPPDTMIRCDGKTAYLLSYGEDGSLGFSFVNPRGDYERSVRERFFICSDCVKASCSCENNSKTKGKNE